MSITTKTGDKGQTSLFTGERVEKGCLRVETYGTIDELDSVLAMARAFVTKHPRTPEDAEPPHGRLREPRQGAAHHDGGGPGDGRRYGSHRGGPA